MNSRNLPITTSAFPLATVLGVVFIVLKLTGTIAWSWWWVLAPFWIPVCLTVLGLLVFLAWVIVIALMTTPTRRWVK